MPFGALKYDDGLLYSQLAFQDPIRRVQSVCSLRLNISPFIGLTFPLDISD